MPGVYVGPFTVHLACDGGFAVDRQGDVPISIFADGVGAIVVDDGHCQVPMTSTSEQPLEYSRGAKSCAQMSVGAVAVSPGEIASASLSGSLEYSVEGRGFFSLENGAADSCRFTSRHSLVLRSAFAAEVVGGFDQSAS